MLVSQWVLREFEGHWFLRRVRLCQWRRQKWLVLKMLRYWLHKWCFIMWLLYVAITQHLLVTFFFVEPPHYFDLACSTQHIDFIHFQSIYRNPQVVCVQQPDTKERKPTPSNREPTTCQRPTGKRWTRVSNSLAHTNCQITFYILAKERGSGGAQIE